MQPSMNGSETMPRGRPTRKEMARKPAGMPRQKLKTEGLEPDKKHYFAKESQFKELEEAGYTFVQNHGDIKTGDDQKDHLGSRVTVPASRSSDEKLYLMSIPKKWYEENQKVKQDLIDAQEREMFNRGDTETTYTVKGTRKEGHVK